MGNQDHFVSRRVYYSLGYEASYMFLARDIISACFFLYSFSIVVIDTRNNQVKDRLGHGLNHPALRHDESR